jgi:phosphoribosyl 1,2-cyclic phosphodiesterase
MRVTLWGTRGSVAAPGAETARYGGNTACVEVRGNDGTLVILDAGTGVRRLGTSLDPSVRRVNLLLGHLHMDHVQGLGFFSPLYDPEMEVHIWGPPSTTATLATRLMRYLSPPLFPVHLRDLPCRLQLHPVPCADFDLGELRVSTALVCHPGPTVGFRLTSPSGTVTYLSDHEPALGAKRFPLDGEWTSGYALAHRADLLIHDAQYARDEYPLHVGWGHSSIDHALTFARLAEVKHLVPFHHDPAHDDAELDRLLAPDALAPSLPFGVTPAKEGAVFQL